MFPTTIWTTIRQAGEEEPAALDDFARRYRAPVLSFVRSRGFRGADAEDVCQDVFVRVLAGKVLAKADRSRGRFRSLLLSVTNHVIQDRLRRRRELTGDGLEPVDHDFDQAWAWHLTARALARLRDQGLPYYDVLEGHLGGRKQDRNKLWSARRKLAALVRREIAFTCATRADFEEELAYLAHYLRPPQA